MAKYESFTKAADSLYLTQPTISKMIKSLEEDLEVVRILDARVNEQIKAQFEKEADQTKSFAEIPDDLSNYRI